jgi:hypothetical protein
VERVADKEKKPRIRRHHHTPRFYLARFTDTGEAEGHLFVHDLIVGGEPRHQKPWGCGFENDLYEVFEEGLERDDVEKWIGANRDGPGSAAIDHVIEQGQIPSKGSLDFRDLMRFISFASVRSPGFKAVTTTWHQGQDKKTRQNAFLSELLRNAKRIVPYLTARSWRLWAPRSGEFITSDQPMGCLNPVNAPFQPGDALAKRDVAVFFALSPQMAIEGRGLGGCTGVSEADSATVAVINGCIAADAHRYVYTRKHSFSWANYGATKPVVYSREEFIPAWRERKGLKR